MNKKYTVTFSLIFLTLFSGISLSADLKRDWDGGEYRGITSKNKKITITTEGGVGANYKIYKNGQKVGWIGFSPKGYGQRYSMINLTNQRFQVNMSCDTPRGKSGTKFNLGANRITEGSIGTSGRSHCDPDMVNITLR